MVQTCCERSRKQCSQFVIFLSASALALKNGLPLIKMLSDDTSTDVLSSLLQHCKLQVSYVMAGGWPAFCSLARGMEATPCGLSEASIAVH